MTNPTPHQGFVGVVIGGVVYIDHIRPTCPAPDQDPLARTHKRITDLHRNVRYLTAPRWKRPFLRLLRWLR
ncbi:Uncharacterised protein [Mycobacteroides abscessus subsp. massiliense]|nr:Uncharacterised protein [Mycobacteroides abscessus subsp. massiliense]